MSKQQTQYAAPATKAQRQFAKDLGIQIPVKATKRELSKLITREVRRRGRLALREDDYTVDTIVRHPRHLFCNIDRIGDKSLKVTLRRLDDQRKVVIDAMQLANCEKVA